MKTLGLRLCVRDRKRLFCTRASRWTINLCTAQRENLTAFLTFLYKQMFFQMCKHKTFPRGKCKMKHFHLKYHVKGVLNKHKNTFHSRNFPYLSKAEVEVSSSLTCLFWAGGKVADYRAMFTIFHQTKHG